DKQFREDLYYRINVLTIHLPPLRQREGDLPLLVTHLLGNEWHLDPDVIPVLQRYSWPGNVRQLQNALDRAKILANDDHIRVENLPPEIVNSAHLRPATVAASDVDLDTLTRDHVLETYRRHGNNKARTARALGIGRRTLYRLLEKYETASPDDGSR
ncbi:MAG TPA: helix-turn-helix domain-containing protein, partial [Lacipirellulaceae bacterium]|nr:helix-turn-helix domain-containing protein [Lacipirellulaceae bacterium]